MPLDTQTFALSRWWARASLKRLTLEPQLFAGANMRKARIDLIAGKNQLTAIKNWLSASQLIERVTGGYETSRLAKHILQNDPEFERSSTWWAFHLQTCFGADPYPYDALFRGLDADLRLPVTYKELVKRLVQDGPGLAQDSVETYLQGVLRMFRDDGPLQGLGLLDMRKMDGGIERESVYRLGTPIIPTEAVLFGISLMKAKFFAGRTSLDFSEMTAQSVDKYLALSGDELRSRIREISRDPRWNDFLKFNDTANLESLSFGAFFKPDAMLVKLLKEGDDSWQ